MGTTHPLRLSSLTSISAGHIRAWHSTHERNSSLHVGRVQPDRPQLLVMPQRHSTSRPHKARNRLRQLRESCWTSRKAKGSRMRASREPPRSSRGRSRCSPSRLLLALASCGRTRVRSSLQRLGVDPRGGGSHFGWSLRRARSRRSIAQRECSTMSANCLMLPYSGRLPGHCAGSQAHPTWDAASPDDLRDASWSWIREGCVFRSETSSSLDQTFAARCCRFSASC